MSSNKLGTILNLSNQANLYDSNKTSLFQHNHILLLGLEYLNERCKDENKNPITLSISKSGEVEISGLDEDIINDKDKMRIYSDKKVTDSNN